ncbi:pilus assembly protein TadG-related protein [Stratiformator vulcanicus]|uniref:von Willebrand factor type A domain protein n=1 Tax=Stratiformator vulcanicus TaxID=2527980 RepID=A0A517R458_9PLAN|nr:pilus assembly protein TadG-related protein [Stratiformator vulcanicus]QDT38613.1 von Willebrand factor type A domain protein [Stratiformator vulcanicus]
MKNYRMPFGEKFRRLWRQRRERKGVFAVIAGATLVAALGFVALSVDIAMISFMKTKLQNAVDAAALAAAQEITATVEAAGQSGEGGSAAADVNSIAEAAAREVASKVAELNGVYVDPDSDVRFGKRVFDEGTETFQVVWDATPYNVVGVTARMDNPDHSAPDSEMELFFAPIFGKDSQQISASAAAFVEARDIVVVLDYSRSMNYDSQFRGFDHLGRQAVLDNQAEIIEALGVDTGSLPFEPEYFTQVGVPQNNSQGTPHIEVTFKGNSVDITSTHEINMIWLRDTDGNYRSFNSPGVSSGEFFDHSNDMIDGVWVQSWNNDDRFGYYGEEFGATNYDIREEYGLNDIDYPYHSGSWSDFINYCRYSDTVEDAEYDWKYGQANFVNYLLDQKTQNYKTQDMWKAPHQPFTAMKNGVSLFYEFLEGLEFGDYTGLVTYDSDARWETELYLADEGVDVSCDPISNSYDTLDTIQRHKQAGHYDVFTGMGYGMEEARGMLDEHGRFGARPTILLMTDGNANRSPGDFSLPSDWDWDKMTDFDGDGNADYTTGNRHRQYVFWQVREAVNSGYTVHTMSLGAGADRNLMKALAFAGRGLWIDAPGGSTIAELEDQLRVAFGKIAANVPPPQLLYEDTEQ